MMNVILFTVLTLLAIASVMLIPINNKNENGATRLIVSAITVMGLWCLFVSIIGLFGSNLSANVVNICSLLIIVLSFAIICLKKKIQKFYVDYRDVTVLLGLLGLVILFAYCRFGKGLSVFTYDSMDSVVHLDAASSIINGASINSFTRIFLYIIDVALMGTFSSVLGDTFYYVPFIVADIVIFYLTTAMFYILVRKHCQGKYMIGVSIICTLLFALGYPLNVILFGFEYLGAGVMVTAYLIWILEEIGDDRLNMASAMALLMIANLSLLHSYTQFAPGVFFGEIVFLAIYLKRREKLLSINTLLLVAVAYVIPGFISVGYIAPRYMKMLTIAICAAATVIGVCVICWYLVISNFAKKNGSTFKKESKRIKSAFSRNKKLKCIVGAVFAVIAVIVFYVVIYKGMIEKYTSEAGMANDGYIFREPYATFILLIFPFVCFIAYLWKNKKNEPVFWIFVGSSVMTVWVFAQVLSSRIGSYYFYKMHFLMWLLVWYSAYRAIASKEIMQNRLQYIITYVLLFALFALGVDRKLTSLNDWVWKDSVGTTLFGIYDYNLTSLKKGGNVSPDMQVMLNTVRSVVIENEEFIPFFGLNVKYNKDYYYKLTAQDPAKHLANLFKEDAMVEDVVGYLKDMGVKHIFIEAGYEEDGLYRDELLSLRCIFENSYGGLYEVE